MVTADDAMASLMGARKAAMLGLGEGCACSDSGSREHRPLVMHCPDKSVRALSPQTTAQPSKRSLDSATTSPSNATVSL